MIKLIIKYLSIRTLIACILYFTLFGIYHSIGSLELAALATVLIALNINIKE